MKAERSQPIFYNDLAQSLEMAWSLLENGGRDRHSGFHALSVASVEKNTFGYMPCVRTMILREANRLNRTLRFHADQRAPKFSQISNNPNVSVSHYDATQKIALRVSGLGKFHLGNEIAATAWQQMRDISRFGYRSPKAPGEIIHSTDEYLMPDSHSVTKFDQVARQNFCVLMITIVELEWIFLDSQGNRRARFTWPEGNLSAEWLQH
jgi:pyridoxamine 5'-phosphate oxidase